MLRDQLSPSFPAGGSMLMNVMSVLKRFCPTCEVRPLRGGSSFFAGRAALAELLQLRTDTRNRAPVPAKPSCLHVALNRDCLLTNGSTFRSVF
jgi:hypothetical protein